MVSQEFARKLAEEFVTTEPHESSEYQQVLKERSIENQVETIEELGFYNGRNRVWIAELNGVRLEDLPHPKEDIGQISSQETTQSGSTDRMLEDLAQIEEYNREIKRVTSELEHWTLKPLWSPNDGEREFYELEEEFFKRGSFLSLNMNSLTDQEKLDISFESYKIWEQLERINQDSRFQAKKDLEKELERVATIITSRYQKGLKLIDIHRVNEAILEYKAIKEIIQSCGLEGLSKIRRLEQANEVLLKVIKFIGEGEDIENLLEIGFALPGYVVLEKIGSGGTKTAYRAKKEDEDVVIYKYNPNPRVQQFLKEKNAEISELPKRDSKVSPYRLTHQNICPFTIEKDPNTGEYFGTSPLCTGDLEQLLEQQPEQKAEALRQILEGLAYSHKRGIVHSDIKPDNILYIEDEYGIEVKLADFGLSQTLEQIRDGDNSLMSIGQVDIRAPELHIGAERGLQADIWSMGVLIYWMYCGEYPFTPNTERPSVPGPKRDLFDNEAYNLKIEESYRENIFEMARERMSEGMIPIVEKCLEVDPSKRYQDAEELKKAVNQISF